MMRSEYPPLPPSMPMPGGVPNEPSAKSLLIFDLLKEPGNENCADCGYLLSNDNAWAVLSYGILVCDDCKLVHIDHENHYKSPETNSSANNESSLKGILSTKLPNLWEDNDIAQIRANGNKRTNSRLLSKSPVWQYRPSGNDGIKLKEYWIKCKYSGNAGEAAENPKMATKKPFIGIQFTRPMPKGNYPCCAVLQSDTLYLTSDIRNEEVPVECIETLVVNSKRIGHENGVQLTYRIQGSNDGNTVAFTYLQHDNMDTVMDWVNLVLYTKYNLLKRKYPTMIDQNVAKILNCALVKESYMHVSGIGLVYLSLSEARLSCFQHHLDDKPFFEIAVSEALNLTATQYLDAVACYFNIDANKILSYGDWLNALELVLKTDKISAMPDDVPKPTFPFSLLKKAEKAPAPTPPVVERVEPPPPITHISAPTIAPAVTMNSIQSTVNSQQPKQQPQQQSHQQPINGEKEGDKKPSNYECYPPIGPMGEMGKVFRGELPPDAIKPPASKSELARIGNVFGEYMPAMSQVPQLMKSSYGELGQLTNPTLTAFASATLNNAIMNTPVTKESVCYPPIAGPQQQFKLQFEMAQAQARFRRAPLDMDDLRNSAAGAMLPENLYQRSLSQQKQLYDQRFTNGLVGRFPDDVASNFTSGLPQSYQGWGDTQSDSLLTVPWKQTLNGYEPSTRTFNQSAQFQDQLNWTKLQQAAALERKLPTQGSKGMGSYGSWSGQPPTLENLPQQPPLTRTASGWGVNGDWTNKQVSLDSFNLSNSRDPRSQVGGLPRDFGLIGGGSGSSQGLGINGKLVNRSNSVSSGSGASSTQQTIVENLLRQWKSAEQKLLGLIHNGYVPASDMSPAGLDKDSAEHAYTCVSELFELLWKQRYDLALSFLRGFREVFANSVHPEIRSLFIGVGELDTMKQIFLQQGKEKFLSGNSGGPVTWKQPTPPSSAPPAAVTSAPTDTAWPNSSDLSTRNATSDYSPWGPFSPTSSESWGAAPGVSSSSRSASISSDPWSSNNNFFSASTGVNASSQSFNRAPSRPVSHSHSGFGENSPTEGSFGSKTSSNSTSPRVITPPTGFDPMMTNTSLAGIESTLKNIFLNSTD